MIEIGSIGTAAAVAVIAGAIAIEVTADSIRALPSEGVKMTEKGMVRAAVLVLVIGTIVAEVEEPTLIDVPHGILLFVPANVCVAKYALFSQR